MNNKFLELYNHHYDKIDFSLTIDELKDLANQTKLYNLIHYKIEGGSVQLVDGSEKYKNHYLTRQVMDVLELVAQKYSDFNTELLFQTSDVPDPTFYNLPVFTASNKPSKNIFNPVLFHDLIKSINIFETRSSNQLKFNEKKTRVFGRYGISGLQGITINNWTSYYKVQFALASLMSPELVDIKFLFVPHDFKYWESYINEMFPSDIKDVILSMPIYDTHTTNLWIQTLDQAFDSKILFFNEGNSCCSIGRILTCLYNDGVVCKIGITEHSSFLDILIESIDERIIYSTHEYPDNKFYASMEKSLSDEKYRNNKNKIAKEFFTQENIIDLTYQTLKLYNVLIRK